MTDRLLNVQEVAEALGVAVPTVWRRIANGDFPKPCKFGHASRWPESDLSAAVDRLKAQRDSEAA